MTTRNLIISPRLRAVLHRLREALGVTNAPVVDAAHVHEVEAFVDSAVPDAVVALLVAQGKSIGTVSRETALYRASAGPLQPRAQRGRREELVCFDSWGEYPLFSVGFRPTREREEPRLIVWDHKRWVPVPEFGIDTLARYVKARYCGVHRSQDEPLPLDLRAAPSLIDAAFEPQIVAVVPRVRHVVHPMFGRGTVVGEIEGRLDIAFEDGARRTILSRFVNEAP